ncbi:hypothetical protein J2785_007400 [Burkholderia ambifaria]|nr:hypothetical protein [Burkholderia ambifaria]
MQEPLFTAVKLEDFALADHRYGRCGCWSIGH